MNDPKDKSAYPKAYLANRTIPLPPNNPDPLTLMQAIIEAYKNWRVNPTADHWADLDSVVRYADAVAKEVEAKLHPEKL